MAVDFSDFDKQRTRYQNLLIENTRIMKDRLDSVAEPEIGTFNIAMPSKRRLAVFEKICPEKKCKGKNGGNKRI